MDESEANGHAGDQDSGENKPVSQGDRIAPYRWRPGQSGNPGGRPRSPDMVLAKARALAKESSIEALATLVAIMRASKDQKLQAWCAHKVIEVAGEVAVAKVDALTGVPAKASAAQGPRELERVFNQFSREALHALARTGLEGAAVTLDVTPNRVKTEQSGVDVGVESGSQSGSQRGPVSRRGHEGRADNAPTELVPEVPSPGGGTITGTPQVPRGERSDPDIEADKQLSESMLPPHGESS